MSRATASKSESLRRVLKAFVKYNLTRVQSVGIEVTQRRVSCTAVSAPPGTPTPRWLRATEGTIWQQICKNRYRYTDKKLVNQMRSTFVNLYKTLDFHSA